ncbi:hypothetical protein D3C76_1200750 [compost metagenome]
MRENLGAVFAIEPGVGDDGIGETVTGIHLFQPPGLGDLLIAGAFGLDVHRADQALMTGQVKEVFGQEVLTQRVVVPEEKIFVILLLQPWIVAAAEVPQMMVGIDDWQRIFCGEVCQAVAFMQADHHDAP